MDPTNPFSKLLLQSEHFNSAVSDSKVGARVAPGDHDGASRVQDPPVAPAGPAGGRSAMDSKSWLVRELLEPHDGRVVDEIVMPMSGEPRFVVYVADRDLDAHVGILRQVGVPAAVLQRHSEAFDDYIDVTLAIRDRSLGCASYFATAFGENVADGDVTFHVAKLIQSLPPNGRLLLGDSYAGLLFNALSASRADAGDRGRDRDRGSLRPIPPLSRRDLDKVRVFHVPEDEVDAHGKVVRLVEPRFIDPPWKDRRADSKARAVRHGI